MGPIVTESGSPTFHGARFPPIDTSSQRSAPGKEISEPGSDARAVVGYDESEEGDNDADFGDDFDDFEEGAEDAGFGDFDSGFQEAKAVPVPSLQSLPTIAPSIVSRSAVCIYQHAKVTTVSAC